jgi:hypothetical protein
MERDEPDKRLELVLAESLRALTYQQSALDNLRSRATLLTGGAALVSSSFVGAVFQGKQWGIATVVAISAMTGVLLLALAICAPVWRWRFLSSAAQLLAAVNADHGLDSMRRHLALDFEQWLETNQVKLRFLQWCFIVGLILLLVEISAWGLQISQLRG